MCLNYLQGRDKMISKFKFFHGIINTKFTVQWSPELEHDFNSDYAIDAEEELTRIMSEEISREIDNNVIESITRIINGGSNHGVDYLNHWLRMGDNRA